MGDTTGIEDMGDFDFEQELKKFDKKQVFDEIRQGDTTADEDRLVSHNRARPGTYGGKNLHPTEPVLSPTVQPVYNSHELSDAAFVVAQPVVEAPFRKPFAPPAEHVIPLLIAGMYTRVIHIPHIRTQ